MSYPFHFPATCCREPTKPTMKKCVVIELPIGIRDKSSIKTAMVMLGGETRLRHTLRLHTRETAAHTAVQCSPSESQKAKTVANLAVSPAFNVSQVASAIGVLPKTVEFKFEPENPFSPPIYANRIPDPTPIFTNQVTSSQPTDCFIYDPSTNKITKEACTLYNFNKMAGFETVPNHLSLPSWNDKPATPAASPTTTTATTTQPPISVVANATTSIGPLPMKLGNWANMPRTFLH